MIVHFLFALLSDGPRSGVNNLLCRLAICEKICFQSVCQLSTWHPATSYKMFFHLAVKLDMASTESSFFSFHPLVKPTKIMNKNRGKY